MFDRNIILLSLVVIGIGVLPSLSRYDLHNQGEKIFLLDKWTGKVWEYNSSASFWSSTSSAQ
jgi:hypothetical protein